MRRLLCIAALTACSNGATGPGGGGDLAPSGDYAGTGDTRGGDATLPPGDRRGTGDVNPGDTTGGDTAPPNLPDFCNVQFPQIGYAQQGVAESLYGQVYEPGLTDTSDGDSRIAAEVWLGPTGQDPIGNPAVFASQAALLNGAVSGQNNDEFLADVTRSAGVFAYAFRFSVNSGAAWQFCDIDGTTTPAEFIPHNMGALFVLPDAQAADDLIDYCRVWQPTPDPGDVVSVEVFEPNITADCTMACTPNGGSESGRIEAQAGYGAPGNNPVLLGYTWAAMLPYKGLGPAAMNNYEYEGPVYTVPPLSRTYSVTVRVRRADILGAEWVYCDTDPSIMDFQHTATTTMTIP